jgi:hypothetical protein
MEALKAAPRKVSAGTTNVNRRNISGSKGRPAGVRLDDNVREALEKLARDDDRSISYMINKILTEYLRARKLLK